MRERFSTREVARLAGVPLSTLQYWVKEGFVTPAKPGEGGPGGGHEWEFTDLLVVKVAAELREALETNLRVLRRVQAAVREYAGDSLAGVVLVVSSDDVLLEDDTKRLMSLLKEPGQLAVQQIINLENVEQEMRERVEELAA